jgi:hypothetical protein
MGATVQQATDKGNDPKGWHTFPWSRTFVRPTLAARSTHSKKLTAAGGHRAIAAHWGVA